MLSGGAGFDALDGGSGSDWCFTDAGGGTKTACELPIIIPSLALFQLGQYAHRVPVRTDRVKCAPMAGSAAATW